MNSHDGLSDFNDDEVTSSGQFYSFILKNNQKYCRIPAFFRHLVFVEHVECRPSRFLSMGQFTYGPTYCLSIDTLYTLERMWVSIDMQYVET